MWNQAAFRYDQLVEAPWNIFFILNTNTAMLYSSHKHTKQHNIKLCLYSSSATYTNQLQPTANTGRAQSIQITHCLAAWVPSMPNQFSAIDSFNVLHCTLRVCMCVCAWKDNLEGELFSVLYHTHAPVWQEIWRLCSVWVLIDTNEQGLADQRWAVSRSDSHHGYRFLIT